MLFPSLSDEKGICVNSPGRVELQKATSLASLNIRILGKGSFGSVILGSWRGKRVAVKILNKRHSSSVSKDISGATKAVDTVANELNAKDLVHDHVVRIYGVYPDPEMNSVIIMEYVGKSNLQTLLDSQPHMIDSEFTQRCLINISSALKFIHSKGILHMDVKPSNVFVTSSGVCKLGDFGCSRKVDCTKPNSDVENNLLVGTSGYQAPEYLQDKRPTEKCDVYSFGVMMWQILNKEYPFKNCHPHSVLFLVVSQHKRPENEQKASNVGEEYKTLYKRCWAQKPNARPSMETVNDILVGLKENKKRRKSSSLRV